MTKEWKVACKDCGKPFGYSDTSYIAGMERGFSRPERCPECRKRHAREIQTVGMPFVKVKPLHPASIVEGIESGALGKISHPPREHINYQIPSSLDTSKFGITEAKLYELFEKLQRFQVVVVVGPTGSGKSTYLPYRLMAPPQGIDPQIFTRYGQILVTQPRIQAARNIPAYVAKVMHGSSIGAGFDVGFRHSNTPASDWRCKLVYVTDGTLINWIVTGQISNLSIIMIDEAHERSLNIDLILGLLKKLLPRYPRLKLIVASATIDHEKFIRYFGGEERVGFVEFEGKSYGVTEHYREDLEKAILPYNPEAVPQLAKNIHIEVSEQIIDLLKRMYLEDGDLHNKRGDILAFLHGVKPIEDAVTLVKQNVEEIPELAGLVDVLPLYTTLPQEKQDQALGKPDWMKELEASHGYDSLSPTEQESAIRNALYHSRRRVVISTNVAETSLTVHGILHVVECGIINQDAWDAQTQTTVVTPVLHSRAGCRQRWGRAGRLMAGDAYCLYTRQQFEQVFQGYSLPQILRAPLEQIVLTAKAAGIDNLEDFPWIDPPKTEELERAKNNLVGKKALDTDGDLTEHGLELQSFSEEPNLANMMVLADRFGCAIEMATLIPIMKLGGFTRLLKRERNWDAHTRRAVRRIHRALTDPCVDDIELCLKLYAAWSQSTNETSLDDTWAFRQIWSNYLPGLERSVKDQMSESQAQELMRFAHSVTEPEELFQFITDLGIGVEILGGWLAKVSAAVSTARPSAWAKMFFTNHSVLKSKVQFEREKLIDALSAHKKEDERRPIDFDLLTRLRIVFAYALPERIYHLSDQVTEQGELVFRPKRFVQNQPDIPAVISNYSICYQKKLDTFVCSKQQTVNRRLGQDADPTQVMMVSFLAKVDPRWLPEILGLSQLELGYFIAKEARQNNDSRLSEQAYDRLMIDHRYPLDTRYLCRILDTMVNENNEMAVEIQQRIASSPPVYEVFRSGEAASPEDVDNEGSAGDLLVNTALDEDDVIAIDPQEDLEPAWVDLAQEETDTLEEQLVCSACGEANALGTYYCWNCNELLLEMSTDSSTAGSQTVRSCLITDGQSKSIGDMIPAEVIGYDIDHTEGPTVRLRPIPEVEPFIAFTSKYHQGDVIEVNVVEHDIYPGDPLMALVVIEPHSRLEVVIEPSDLTFSTRGCFVKEITIGTKIEVVIEAINSEYRRVRLSCHRFIDYYQNELFANSNEAVVEGRVLETTDQGVHFLLKWGNIERGIVLGAYARQSGLIKQPREYSVNERLVVSVGPSNKPKSRPLDQLPRDVEKNLVMRKWNNRLVWDETRRTLSFSGLMTYSEYRELRGYADDPPYQDVIDGLYFLCNQLEASIVRQFSARAMIPGKAIRTLIGPGGENINRIRSETSTSIQIDRDRGLVTVGAETQDQLDTGIRAILEILNYPLSFQPIKSAIPREWGNQPATNETDFIVSQKITINKSRIGTLIGAQGATLDALQSKTATHITINDETAEVTVSGLSEENVKQALEMIQELTTVYSAALKISDQKKIGWIIGKGGETIKRLKAETRSNIFVDNEKSLVTIESNTIEQVELTMVKISEIVTSYSASFKENNSSIRGRIIGKGGSTVKQIRELTDTVISVDNDSGVIQISGKSEASVRSALDHISRETGLNTLQVSVNIIDSPIVVNRSY